MKIRLMSALSMALGLGLGCGDDSGGASSQGVQTCYDVCMAQDTAERAGDCVAVPLADCRAVCDLAAGGECWDELTAVHGCSLQGEFSCGLFSAESDADCDAELEAYTDCGLGGGGCAGADEDGFCPAVACPCPDGEIMISGTTSEGGQCACVDAETCQELCF